MGQAGAMYGQGAAACRSRGDLAAHLLLCCATCFRLVPSSSLYDCRTQDDRHPNGNGFEGKESCSVVLMA